MAIFHFTVSVRSRAKGSSSSIAGSAYLSGQKRKDEREGRSWNFANKEEEVLFHQVLLPESAPKKWKQQADRGEYAKVANTLWNSVEKAESQSNARVCRNFEWAMPNELPLDEQKRLASEFIQKYLVDQGMCVEYSICLKIGENGQPNIHVHAQATLRRIKEDETWEAKTQKKYLCRNSEGEEKYLRPDELKEQPEFQKVYKYRVNGKIEKWTPEQAEQYVKSQNPNIEPKALRQELKDLRASKYALYENAETVDWNEKGKVEEWRAAWAETANKYLEKYGQEIDHRSYERQGIDRIPTIHEGYMSKKMEQQGAVSDRAEINREIKKANEEIHILSLLLEKIGRLKIAFKNAIDRIRQRQNEESKENQPKIEWSENQDFLYIDFPDFSVVIDFSKMKIQYFSDSSLTYEIGRDELKDPEDDIIQDILEKETVLTIEDFELEDQLEAEEELKM